MQMYKKIQRWGNSLAVRLPKVVLEETGMGEDDTVFIKSEKGYIIISYAGRRHKSLEERIRDFEGKSTNEELIADDL
jgi:antitoxin MazE